MNRQQNGNEASKELLVVDQIEVIYDESVLAVSDVSLTVNRGEIVTVLGVNGAGKSTTLKAISGLVHADRAKVSKGRIHFKGESNIGVAAHRLAHRNIVHVLEGRHVFSRLTVEENLKSGTFLHKLSNQQVKTDLERVYRWFPRLKEKRATQAGMCSGGEQQMLAIGRALLTRPDLVLLDEPSMGLAPILVQEIFSIIASLNKEEGMSFLVAEQNIRQSLKYAHRAYVIDSGKVVLSGSAQDLAQRDDLHQIYLGQQSEGSAPEEAH